MAGIRELAGVWKNIKEIDLRPFSAEAERGVKIALLGHRPDRLGFLADQMRRDPSRREINTQSPVLLVDLHAETDLQAKLKEASQADLIIYLRQAPDQPPAWLGEWLISAPGPCLVIDEPADHGQPGQANPPEGGMNWSKRRVIAGSFDSPGFLQQEFVPTVLALLPERHLALGRHFPLFRVAIAQKLIQDTCLSNAAYSLSTGIAEIVPVFDLPLNITDMVILSKTQAFLVYKLGLALGFTTRWQEYLAEFGSVLGGGFVWRQIARQLVGLIPAWGIIPKVAVAYAGTYVVGNVVLQWYLTGRKVSRAQMRQLYGQAFARGKRLASNMAARLPPRRSRRSQPPVLPETETGRKCPQCGRLSAADALFCQYCAASLEPGAAE